MEDFTGGGTPAADSIVSKTKPSTNLLTLNASGGDFTGWQAIRVTRRIEGCPNDFDISMSERLPGQQQFQIKPGDPCTIKIDNDIVVTGFVDRVGISISSTHHTVRVSGRGKCEDIVDCSIKPNRLNSISFTTSSLLDLAQTLAGDYNVKVISLTGDNVPVSLSNGTPVVFNGVLTETPFEIIERVARYAGVLVYEDANGDLVLANVGTGQHSSGFAQGVNVQAAAAVFSMDERYSDYLPTLLSVNSFGDAGIGGMSFPVVHDAGVPRFRQLIVVSEQNQLGQFIAEKRAQWEAARRYGRSQAVRITCDSWRDSGGLLWQPNYYAGVDLPALKITTASDPFVIGEVHYMVDQDRGSVAELLLMPKQAFLPEPNILRPNPWDPTVAAGSGGATANPPT